MPGQIPTSSKIFHLTHMDNLASIIADGRLLPDAAMIARGGPATSVGMSSIKQRRLRLPVICHPGTFVGDYVPFYFCARSVMLYLLHKGNENLAYEQGQGPIVHLEADLAATVAWADAHRLRWAFTLGNAGADYQEFRADWAQLGEVNWNSVAARLWSGPGIAAEVKQEKQAEFLLHQGFPWDLVSQIGVLTVKAKEYVEKSLLNAAHRPPVLVRPNWYY